ncbi:TPA: hypothetical protein vir249_00052 [Ariesvirus gravis]|jgi:hypothetical protein|uniref:Uncharacterized protein n=1 Tax=Caudoviricetes sp. vir249 TaxID=3068355 RepID=A0AA87CHU4_9CAUD|nr:TPA_asm: hypothetical protein vir249_00052 [Caudoviricetes sp. vir249]
MNAETVALAVSRFKLSPNHKLKLVFNCAEYLYDNSILIECNNTCMTLSSKLDDGKIHTLYIEYQFIQGVEVIEG